jgi:hypothetical protein
VTLTKALRWDIQSLGTRFEKASGADEASPKRKRDAKTRALYDAEIQQIIDDMAALIIRIDDAVPLINLAIATSGANLSTGLPNSVSPSRLMQASTLLSHGDSVYIQDPSQPSQIGPPLTLSLYMLFAGHATVGGNVHQNGKSKNEQNPRKEERDMTWKEVIHKAQVKLMRVPMQQAGHLSTGGVPGPSPTSGTNASSEYSYQLHIIEDLDDDRVHNFEDDGPQPGPFGGVKLAGIREVLPVHQISRIFYADTGKILNIGNEGEPNSPILLLKRDITAKAPTTMMEEDEIKEDFSAQPLQALVNEALDYDDDEEEEQDDIDQQIRRESSIYPEVLATEPATQRFDDVWRFPPGLDPEWMAFEVYNEVEDCESEADEESLDESTSVSSSSVPDEIAQPLSPSEELLNKSLKSLHLGSESPIASPSPVPTPFNQLIRTPAARRADSSLPDRNETYSSPSPNIDARPPSDPYGVIRTSLSLLEMLIRLTSLQQFQQASHLSIPDQTLNFFLTDASTTGGLNSDARREARYQARRKTGFDPYDESPIRHHDEEYQRYGGGYSSPVRGQQFQEDYERYTQYESDGESQRHVSESPSLPPRTIEPRQRHYTPEPWLTRNRDMTSSDPRQTGSDRAAYTPESPYRPVKKSTRPLVRVKQETGRMKGSPLGRGMSVETDSTLGTSPGTPTYVNSIETGRGE